MEQALREEPTPVKTPFRSNVQTRAQKKKALETLLFNIDAVAPKHFYDIKNFNDKQKWYEAYYSEIRSLEETGKLKVVDRPSDKEILSILELFKYKYDNLNKKVKAKVRIVVRGDLEKNDFDPNLIYAPVAGLDIIRLVLIICYMYGLYFVQIDIKTAFLYGKRQIAIYITLPIGHKLKKLNKVWKTLTSIYGLRDAPKLWFKLLNDTLLGFGLKQCPIAQCLYTMKNLLVVIYVDDILFCSNDKNKLKEFESYLLKHFKLDSTSKVVKYVGYEMVQKANGYKLVATDRIKAACERFRLSDSKRRHYPINSGYIMNTETKQDDILNDLTLYQSLVGTLHHINSLCRPDISYITNYLARKTRSASSRDLQIAKNVMVYLFTTANQGIVVKKPKKQIHC